MVARRRPNAKTARQAVALTKWLWALLDESCSKASNNKSLRFESQKFLSYYSFVDLALLACRNVAIPIAFIIL